MRCVQSYSDRGWRGQSPVAVRVLVLTLISLTLAGCAGMGLPFEEASASRPASAGDGLKPIPASATVTVDRVDPSDWKEVRATLAVAPPGRTTGLDWLNADTGSTGTITAAATTTASGLACRAFATTVNDVRGIRRYRGDACRTAASGWQLRDLTPDDAAIS